MGGGGGVGFLSRSSEILVHWDCSVSSMILADAGDDLERISNAEE